MDSARARKALPVEHVRDDMCGRDDEGVETTSAFDRGDLVLVPLSTSVVMRKTTDEVSVIAVDADVELKDGRDNTKRRKVCARSCKYYAFILQMFDF